MSKEIAFKPGEAAEAATRADFTYKITPRTITITSARKPQGFEITRLRRLESRSSNNRRNGGGEFKRLKRRGKVL